jgi:putative transposase
MGRQPRVLASNILFHVINRGNAQQAVFLVERDYQEYHDLLKHYKEKFDILIYHYVLMSNHVHLLVESMQDGALPKFMQGLTLAHTRRFNDYHRRVGHVWQGRYKSIPIESDAYLLQCGRYIELNPCRAGIADHPSKYPWSSYHRYAGGVTDSVVDEHPFYAELDQGSDRKQRYKEYIEDELPRVFDQSSMRFSEKRAYGGESFIARLEETHGLALPGKAGRPPKIGI